MNFAQRSTHDREILGVESDRTAVDGRCTDHHPIAVRAVLLHTKGVRAMSCELIDLSEGIGIDEKFDPFASRLLTLRVLLLNCPSITCMYCLFNSVAEVLDLSGGCVQISAHGLTVLGVGLSSARAPLDISQLASHYWRVSVVDVTGSTQDDLISRARNSQARHGDVIVANFQSAGRGRLDRSFIAPPSSALLFSIYLQPIRTLWDWLPLLAGQSIAQALSQGSKVIKMKWPNDLMIGEKKVGGIIASRAGSGVVIGIGINVGMTSEEVPVEGATSLYIEGVETLDRTKILNLILESLRKNITLWNENRDEELRIDYRLRSSTLGSPVEVTLANGERTTGIASDISTRGELILDSGEVISVGDVVHLR